MRRPAGRPTKPQPIKLPGFLPVIKVSPDYRPLVDKAVKQPPVVWQMSEKASRFIIFAVSSMCPLVKSAYWAALAVCDTLRMESSNHTFRCYVVGGKRRGQQTSTKLNSDLTKCDYLEWVCIRFVCKYGINH